ncbi:MAG TPA: HEPN domain-containing protein, partial [Geobacteraceae bacterium]|nr:HEPN domain-containing protein [Geobacteraceae bacterium]
MTDREALFTYRLREADETLAEAIRMVDGGFTPRTIVNRAYYAMFYAVLALFIRFDTHHRTSKHSGVIGIFNKEFVRTGKVEIRFSKMLNDLFDARLEGDYRGFVELTSEQARDAVAKAEKFIAVLKELISS